MTEAMTEARLTDAKSRIDELESDARGSLDEKSRIDRHVAALQKAHASARAAVQAADSRFEDTLEELGTKLAIAEHRRAAEVARERDAFVRSVEAELHAWDSYLEQLQRRAAARTGGGRAEDSTSELRLRRNEVARRLGDARTAPDGAWREHREPVLQALDELDHAAGTA
jgi:chromosome segregation ATPase